MFRNRISAKTKRTLLIILTVGLVIILAILVASVAYMESLLNLINKNPDDSTMSASEYQDFLNSQTEEVDPGFTGETMDPGDVDWNLNEDGVVDQAHIINIMLIGQDRRPGEGRQRSDVMILCTVNTETKELTLTSFMRDMYVAIPDYQDNKMNATYAFGGMKLLDKCLEQNFAIHVDGNVEVDFAGFTGVIDLLGGVDIYLSNSEANSLIAQGHSAHAGTCHLNGAAALSYARNRSIGNGDFSRTERQRKVMNALFEKCKGMSLTQLKGLMEKALPMITTDMTNRQILDYLTRIVPMLGSMKVSTQQIPAEGTYKYAYIRDMSVLLPDLEKNREILKKIVE